MFNSRHLKNRLPAIFRHIGESSANCLVPQLPTDPLEHGVGCWDWSELELGRWGELVQGESLASFGLLLRVVLPLHVAFPALSFFLDNESRVIVNGVCTKFCCVGYSRRLGICMDLEIALVS